MKPRIVRESIYGHADLQEENHGPAYLALPWPTGCPWTPERVMARCERGGWALSSVPEVDPWGQWYIWTDGITRRLLTPEFMAEPKRFCPGGHIAVYSPKHGQPDICLECGLPKRCELCKHGDLIYEKCPQCGAILSDRRKGERRKGERRVIGYIHGGGRRGGFELGDFVHDRRSGTDRRRTP